MFALDQPYDELVRWLKDKNISPAYVASELQNIADKN